MLNIGFFYQRCAEGQMFSWHPKQSDANERMGVIHYYDGQIFAEKRSVLFLQYLDARYYVFAWWSDIAPKNFLDAVNRFLRDAGNLPLPIDAATAIIQYLDASGQSDTLEDCPVKLPIAAKGEFCGIPLDAINWMRIDIPGPNRSGENVVQIGSVTGETVEVPGLGPQGLTFCCGFGDNAWRNIDFGAIDALVPLPSLIQFIEETQKQQFSRDDRASLERIIRGLLSPA